MAIKAKEQAIIDLVINGNQAQSSLRELSGAYNALLANVSALRRADNPALYDQQVANLNRVRAARDAERQSVLGVTAAVQQQAQTNKGFFADFKKGFSEIEEMAEHITIGTLIYKGISAGLDAVKELWNGSEEAFKEADLTQTALNNKVKQTGEVAGESITNLQKLQTTLMDLTGVDDDVIAKGEDTLLSFTNIRGEIYNQSIPAIVNYTAAMNKGKVTMEGVQSSAEVLGKGLDDLTKIKKTARAMDVTLTDEEYKQIEAHRKNNEVIAGQQIFLDALNKRYGDLAKNLSESEAGAMQRFETRIGNIQETIGKWIVSGKSLMANFLSPLLTLIEKLTSTKLSDTLEDERMNMNKLALQITDTNTKHEDRIKLINDLKALYPDYLKNLNAEKSTNLEIANAVEKLNDMYINRIILAKKDEEIEKQNQSSAEMRMKQLKAEDEVRTQLAKLKDKYPEIKLPDGTTEEKLSSMLATLKERQDNSGLAGGGIFDPTFAAGRALKELQVITEFTNGAINQGNRMLQKRNELMKELGINEKFNGAGGTDKPVTPPKGGETQEELEAEARARDAAARKAEAYAKQIEDVRAEYLKLAEAAQKGSVDDLDGQLAVIDEKYNRIVTKLQKLAKDPKLSKEFGDKIKSINGPGGLRNQEKSGTFTKVTSTGIADQFKRVTGDIDDNFANGQSNLDGAMNKDLNSVTGTDPAIVEARRLDIQQTYAQKRFELEQKHLEAMKDIYQAYGVSTSDLDKKIADNAIKENDRAAKEKEAKDKAYITAKKELQQMELSTIQEGAQLLESLLDKRSAMYKAALIVDKAVATANIIMATETAVAKFRASVAGLGPFGAGLAIAYEVAARISEGLSIVALGKSVVDAFGSGDSGSTKKAAKGGTFEGPGHDQGGLNVVDPRTGRTVVNVEGGEPWMVLSRETRRNNGALINELLFNSMYRNGARVDVAGVTKGIQVARSGGVFNSPAVASGTPANQTQPVPAHMFDNSELLAEMRLTRQSIQDQKVILSMREFEIAAAKRAQISHNANA